MFFTLGNVRIGASGTNYCLFLIRKKKNSDSRRSYPDPSRITKCAQQQLVGAGDVQHPDQGSGGRGGAARTSSLSSPGEPLVPTCLPSVLLLQLCLGAESAVRPSGKACDTLPFCWFSPVVVCGGAFTVSKAGKAPDPPAEL